MIPKRGMVLATTISVCCALGCGDSSSGNNSVPDAGGSTDVGGSTSDSGGASDMAVSMDMGTPEDMGVAGDSGGVRDSGAPLDCSVDEYVDGDVCVACAPGSTSEGGSVSACDAVLCAADEYVSNHVCTPCSVGETNVAGDDASGVDTTCDVPGDACVAALGVACSAFDEAYLKASMSGAGDLFGFSVAISGDTLAIGAYKEASDATGVGGDETSNQATDSGAVYVFTRAGTTWTQQAYIKASNTGLLDYFGYAIALDGDTLAVGAYGENSAALGVDGSQNDENAPQSGAVYVFTRSGTTWSQQAYLKASNTDADDFFGGSLALSGETLAVGANREDSSATGVDGDQGDNSAMDSGAVYLFTRAGTTWSQQAYLKASNAEAGDNFGISLALDADSLAVGAYQEDSSATGVNGDENDNNADGGGAAYVFTRAGTVWSQQAYVKASNTGEQDIFGYSVAIEDDTLVVGAHHEDSDATGVDGDGANDNTTRSGAAYVFSRSAGVWTQQAYLKASNPEGGDRFGFSVALSGEMLAIGAANEDGGSTGLGGDDGDNGKQDSGAVFLFTRAAGTWSQRAYVKSSNPDPADGFGRAVALDGGTLVVGALEEDSGAAGVDGDQTSNAASRSGAAYVRRVAP